MTGIMTENRLTNRLHQVHVVHKVSLPQIDGELREEHSHDQPISRQISQSISRQRMKDETFMFDEDEDEEDSPFHWDWLS